jgi:ElaB/YqjD/DUF883 family membrane-anchored ribosome-binding protein
MSAAMAKASRVADDANSQVRRLRGEVEALMRDTVTPALSDALERAATATQYTTERVRRHSETVAGNIRGRPLLSVALAAAVGFFFGRVTR